MCWLAGHGVWHSCGILISWFRCVLWFGCLVWDFLRGFCLPFHHLNWLPLCWSFCYVRWCHCGVLPPCLGCVPLAGCLVWSQLHGFCSPFIFMSWLTSAPFAPVSLRSLCSSPSFQVILPYPIWVAVLWAGCDSFPCLPCVWTPSRCVPSFNSLWQVQVNKI